jgi:hypothetical protein
VPLGYRGRMRRVVLACLLIAAVAVGACGNAPSPNPEKPGRLEKAGGGMPQLPATDEATIVNALRDIQSSCRTGNRRALARDVRQILTVYRVNDPHAIFRSANYPQEVNLQHLLGMVAAQLRACHQAALARQLTAAARAGGGGS